MILDFDLENVENRTSLNEFIFKKIFFEDDNIVELMSLCNFFRNIKNLTKGNEFDFSFIKFNDKVFVLIVKKFNNKLKFSPKHNDIFEYFLDLENIDFLFENHDKKKKFLDKTKDFIYKKTKNEMNMLYNFYYFYNFNNNLKVKNIEEKICKNIPDFMDLMECFDLVEHFSQFFENNIFLENNNKNLIENDLLKIKQGENDETNDSETNDSKTELFHQIKQIKE